MLEAEMNSLSLQSNGHEWYDFVIGIDWGSITSGASIAHKKRPFEIFTVNNWDGVSDSMNASSKQLPTTMFYKKLKKDKESSDADHSPSPRKFCKEDYDFFCGLPPLHTIATMRREADDIYIDYIKQLVLAMDGEFNHPRVSQYGLTVKDVFTDFIKGFHEKVIRAFQTHPTFKQSFYFKTEFSINGNLDNVRYCIACPEALQIDFVKQCFVDAGIIRGDQKEERITFVTESEATAYSCLAQSREETEVQMDKKYLVCDFGYNSFGLSQVTADSTESASKVELISENLEIGSKLFTTKLKNYMVEQKGMSESEADRILKPYEDKEQYFDFELDADEQRVVDTGVNDMAEEDIVYPFGDNIKISKTDLYTHVYLPAISEVEAAISTAYTTRQIENIFISGKYACDTYFKNYLMANNVFGNAVGDNAVLNKVEDSVSVGAVSFGLRKEKTQVPYVTHRRVGIETNQNQNEEDGNDDQSKSPTSSNKYQEDNNRENQKTEKKKNYKYVFGIDFGTTFSGCSYAKYEPEVYAHCKDIEDYRELMMKRIKTIEDWEGDYKFKSGKTPTCIMYKDLSNPKNLVVDSWGREAEDTYDKNRMKKNYKQKLLKDFKLFLEVKHSRENYAKNGEMEFNKKVAASSYNKDNIDVVDIIADYLRCLNDEALRKVSRYPRLTSRDVKYVFTVPAMWGRPARELIAAAAFKANIINEVNEDDFSVISEPEAAALFCETEFDDFLTTDQTFIVCDAGGGTIDLVAFRYTSKKGAKEAEISQIGEPDGAMCGSTYLDLAFEKYVRGYYQKINEDKDSVDISPALKTFVESTKSEFKFRQSNCGDKLSFDLINVKGRRKDYSRGKYCVKNNKLYMTHQQMKDEVFDGVFNQLTNLLDQKIAKLGIEKVDSVLLVGGFGQNAYLQEILTEKYEKNAKSPPEKIKVILSNSDRGVRCVSRGAVSYGLLPRLISQAVVDRSFALEVLAPHQRNTKETKIINGYHTNQDQRYVRNCLEYFIEKNSPLMFENFSISKTIYVERNYSAVIAMYTCDLNPGEEIQNQQDYKFLDPLFHEKAVEMRIDSSELQHSSYRTPLIPIKVTLFIERSRYYFTVECDSRVIQRYEGSNKDDRLINSIRKNPKFELRNVSKKYFNTTSRSKQARFRSRFFASRF